MSFIDYNPGTQSSPCLPYSTLFRSNDSGGKPFVGPNDFASDGHGGVYVSASGVYDIKAPITGAVLHMSAEGKTLTERSEEHTSELQSRFDLVCRLLLEKKNEQHTRH